MKISEEDYIKGFIKYCKLFNFSYNEKDLIEVKKNYERMKENEKQEIKNEFEVNEK